ncbi:MAG TPA: ATP-binding protein [Anaerolineales bacterium]|nr:ATP-binding protein [Anaerolineales bacterium]
MEVPCRKTWSIHADLEIVNSICSEISQWSVEQNLQEHTFPIEILMREALNNAIIHGCQMNAAGNIQVELWCDATALWLKVNDGGAGFKWEDALRVEMASDDQENGRGLKLYQLYADQVEFNECGNQVTLTRLLKDKESSGRV